MSAGYLNKNMLNRRCCMNLSESEILKYAMQNGIIDMDTIQMKIEMNERKKYLEMHQFSIWHGKDELWHTYLPDEEKGRIHKKRKTKKEIEDVIVAYYKSIEQEPYFNKVFYLWLDEKLELGEICKGTYDKYENDFKRFFLKSELYDRKISHITEDDLERFIRKTIAEKSLTTKAYANLRTIVIGIFKYSKKKKYTDISISTFFKDLDISRRAFAKKVKDKESQVFLEDEIPIITKWLREHPTVENLGVLLTFQTGIRVGELSGLKFSDVKGKVIHIQRMEIKYKGGAKNKCTHEIVDYTKTDAGNRHVIVPESALETIEMIRQLNPKHEYMMMSGNRKIWTCTFNDRIYKACAACGIQKKSMHKIRKTYGTTLIDSDTDESLIMAQMGHTDISTTKKYYYYSNKNSKHNMEQIERAIKI